MLSRAGSRHKLHKLTFRAHKRLEPALVLIDTSILHGQVVSASGIMQSKWFFLWTASTVLDV